MFLVFDTGNREWAVWKPRRLPVKILFIILNNDRLGLIWISHMRPRFGFWPDFEIKHYPGRWYVILSIQIRGTIVGSRIIDNSRGRWKRADSTRRRRVGMADCPGTISQLFFNIWILPRVYRFHRAVSSIL